MMTKEAFYELFRYCYYLGLFELGGWYVSVMNDPQNGKLSAETDKIMGYINVSSALDTYRLISRSIIGVYVAKFIITRYVIK